MLIVLMLVSTSFIGVSYTVDKSSTISFNDNTLYVGGNGPGNYSKIQNAINDANNGDTVFVLDDSSPYYENVVVDKSINLVGEDRDTTIIVGGESRSVVVSVSADRVYISGFTIEKSENYSYAGIGISSSYNIILGNTISNGIDGIFIMRNYNIIKDNTIMKNSNGISLWKDSNNNTITENNIISNVQGISLYYSSNNNIRDNNIISNKEMGIGGIYSCNNNTITGNIISKNRGVLFSYSSDYNTISGNIISSNNEFGIEFQNCNFNSVKGNIISWNNDDGISLWASNNNNIIYNIIISNSRAGIYLGSSNTKNTIKGNTISNNTVGINIRFSINNTISRNNLIDNKLNALFKNCKNTWMRNYWNRPRILPKLIFGIKKLENLTIPWFNIDWRPALRPYDIEV